MFTFSVLGQILFTHINYNKLVWMSVHHVIFVWGSSKANRLLPLVNGGPMLGTHTPTAVGHLTYNIQANTTVCSWQRSRTYVRTVWRRTRKRCLWWSEGDLSLISWMLSFVGDFVAVQSISNGHHSFVFSSLCPCAPPPFFFNLNTLTFDLWTRSLTGLSHAYMSEVKPHGRGSYANVKEPNLSL